MSDGFFAQLVHRYLGYWVEWHPWSWWVLYWANWLVRLIGFATAGICFYFSYRLMRQAIRFGALARTRWREALAERRRKRAFFDHRQRP